MIRYYLKSTREQWAVDALCVERLATFLRDKYAAWIHHSFEVRIEVDDDLWPLGEVLVIGADDWTVYDRITITRAVERAA